ADLGRIAADVAGREERIELHVACRTAGVGLVSDLSPAACRLSRRLAVRRACQLLTRGPLNPAFGALVVVKQDGLRDLFRRHQRREVGVGAGHEWKDRSINYAQTLYPPHAPIAIRD